MCECDTELVVEERAVSRGSAAARHPKFGSGKNLQNLALYFVFGAPTYTFFCLVYRSWFCSGSVPFYPKKHIFFSIGGSSYKLGGSLVVFI